MLSLSLPALPQNPGAPTPAPATAPQPAPPTAGSNTAPGTTSSNATHSSPNNNTTNAAATASVLILDLAGTAEILPAGGQVWRKAAPQEQLHPGDRFRTARDSRAVLRLSDLSQLRLGELSELQLQPAPNNNESPIYKLWRGILYFFHRDPGLPRRGPQGEGGFQFATPNSSAAVRGTEFVLAADDTGRSRLTLLEGEVDFHTDTGNISAHSGQQITAAPGTPPSVSVALTAALQQSIQWCLYYPAVLNLGDLVSRPVVSQSVTNFNLSEMSQASVNAYRAGDVLAALRLYPARPEPPTDPERLYQAALLLAVGKVEDAEQLLLPLQTPANRPAPATIRLANALRRFIAVMRGELPTPPSTPAPAPALLPTERLVESYVHQAHLDLSAALAETRATLEQSTSFGLAWTRLAGLEFSFGHTHRAADALDTALALAPQYAPAHALRGFLLSAEQRFAQAEDSFARALAWDGSLGDAWLGRGLCRIRRGQRDAGRLDLQTAVLVEPQRSLWRSYLGKAYQEDRHPVLAERELDRARQLDPRDPTPWLYSALLLGERHRRNEAVHALEQSVALNDHRALYRSHFLLETDRAVRSSSLARIYQDAGLPEISLQEAARAVSDDYANYSAHLFVSDSFNALREPTRSNLRYETVWFSEMLLANLLAPVGGTPLSQSLSSHEYSRLFERNRLGLDTATEYRSDGQFRETASQFGRYDRFGWSLDLDYEHHDGVRPNNELDRLEWYSTFQYQIGPQDSALLLAKYQSFSSGDVFQYYSPTNARPDYNFDESQKPIAAVGYHKEWNPGSHTLFLGSALQSDVLVTDRAAPQAVRLLDPLNQPAGLAAVGLDLRHHVDLEIFGAELQQLLENEHHAFLAGARAQGGLFVTRSRLTNPDQFAADFPVPAAFAEPDEPLERFSAYAYETLKLPGRLRLTGGLTWEHLTYPENFRHPPLAPGTETRQRLLPKAAVVWDALPPLTLRAAYLRSLGGASLDESYRLEPTHLAGFVQDYRSVIPESLASSVSAPDHELWGIATDFKFPTRTYVTLAAQRLQSEVHRSVGAFDYFLSNPLAPRIQPIALRQRLDYDERTASASINQLLSREWSAGARYQFTRSALTQTTPGLTTPVSSGVRNDRAELHVAGASLLYQHPSGFFGQGDARWLWQRNLGGSSALSDDSFPQLDLFAGYRLHRQRGELTLGVMNLTGDDYHLNPVTAHPEYPHERVFYIRLRLTL